MLSEVLRRDTLSQAGRARAANAKPQTDVERLLARQGNAVWALLGDAVFTVLVASSVAWGLASIGHYKGWWDIRAFLPLIMARTCVELKYQTPHAIDATSTRSDDGLPHRSSASRASLSSLTCTSTSCSTG